MAGRKKATRKQETSALAAMGKTALFFALILLFVWGLIGFPGANAPEDRSLSREYQSIDFYDLSNYDYYTPDPEDEANSDTPQNVIPDEVKALSGRKVSISGFMLPVEDDGNGRVSLFVLNGNYDMCYFGAPVMMNQWIVVRAREGQPVLFSHSPIRVYGQLEVGEEVRDGRVVSLYRMQADRVVHD